MKPKLKYILIALVAMISLVVILSWLPFRLVASPASVLRIINENGRPMVNIRVVRVWDTSEGQQGSDQTVTDIKGEARFERIDFRMSQMKRLVKPFLIFVPSSCGPNWEVYGHAEFDIYWPGGYRLQFDDAEWKKANAIYENSEGIHIYDPLQSSNTNYVGLYVFNKREDFEYTLTLYRQHNQ